MEGESRTEKVMDAWRGFWRGDEEIELEEKSVLVDYGYKNMKGLTTVEHAWTGASRRRDRAAEILRGVSRASREETV